MTRRQRLWRQTTPPLAPETWPKDFPSDRLVVPQQAIFKSADGLEIHGQLFLPAGLKPGEKRPALIFLHGGSMRQMLLGWHYMYYYSNSYAMNQYLASRGYVVLALNYRSGIGYGRAFREAPGRAGRGASEYRGRRRRLENICRPAATSTRKRIGLWGGSYGGYLTALGLGRNSDLFAAGVDIHGVHDWPTDNRDGKNISAGLNQARSRFLSGHRREHLEIARALHSRRRRPQRLFHADRRSRRAPPRARRGNRTAHFPR